MGRPAMATYVPSISKGLVTLWALVSLLPVDSLDVATEVLLVCELLFTLMALKLLQL